MAERLDVIDRNARAQTQIIEDILDMSRIVAGKLRLNAAAAVNDAAIVRTRGGHGADTGRTAARGVALAVDAGP